MPEESGDNDAEQLLAAAEQYDAAVDAGETPIVEIETEEPEPEETPEELQAEEAEAEPDAEGQGADEVSSLTEGEAPETEDEPKKSKYARNEERKANTWKNINSTKEEQSAKEKELADWETRLKSQESQVQAGQEYRDGEGFTAAEYKAAAERLKDDGEYDDAEEAVRLAEATEQAGNEASSNREKKAAYDEWEHKFKLTKAELESQNPDLKDVDTKLAKEVNQLLREHSELLYLPNGDGLRHAVRVANWKIAAESSTESVALNKELTDKLTKLEKKMSISGGFTSDRPEGERSFESLSDKEQGSELLKAAMAFDDGR